MFVQNGVQKIEVLVKREGGGGQKGNKSADPEEVTNTDNEMTNDKKHMSRRTKRIIWTNLTHIFAVGRQVGNITMNYAIQGIAMKHGDEALQDRVGRDLERMGDRMNIASSIAMGGTYGAWGGPIGAVIGASLGAISSSVSVGFKYKTREREYGYKMFKENNAIEYRRARANINLTIGRLR